jgi:hypothetical protein
MIKKYEIFLEAKSFGRYKKKSLARPTYVRKEIYTDVQGFLDKVNLNHTKEDKVIMDGDQIKLGSDRYKCFKVSGCKCVNCGLEATFFAKEKSYGSRIDSYHLNLYGIDENGKEVLFTKDHILPKSRGGKDEVSNYQTMCQKCNTEKAHEIPIEMKNQIPQDFIKSSKKIKISKEFTDKLINLPENGAGYQIVNIKMRIGDQYSRETILNNRIIINCEYLIVGENEHIDVSKISDITLC